MNSTRRRFLRNSALVGAAGSIGPHLAMATADKPAPFRTPYKFPKLVLSATHRKGDFDQRSIDDPIVFYANGAFQMLYIGWDGIGYQTGLATSDDLLHWTRTALVAPRDPAAKYTRYNLALSSILPILRNGPRGSATYPATNPIFSTKPPTPDARDSRFASNPFVVQNGHDFAMFYYGFRYQRPGRACEMLALGADPSLPANRPWVPHISLVFGEMWDTTNVDHSPPENESKA